MAFVRARARGCLVLSLLVILHIIGLLCFLKGIFPYKKSLLGNASFADIPSIPNEFGVTENVGKNTNKGKNQDPSHIPSPKYDRLVIMLVDALRNDFVFGDKSEMHFTRSLLKSGKAMGFTARATAPTVTMPRVKALTTGTVPSFLDAVLNIAESDTSSSLAHYDNILWQLKHQGKKKINLFGDDTWIRLFPGIFSRTDGTSSFFVTDTVEVDTNVTRNVKPELLRNDWGVTIFHYLGLDHIGHLGGPDSPLMGPKQKEMDSVVKTIYDIITKQDMERKSENPDSKSTLFVLLGDHGMNFAGNHGGSSHGETSTTLVFMDKDMDFGPSDKPLSALLDKTLPQVNFASTISLLFGVPIPINNIGYPIMELLDQQSGPERLRSLQLCTHQIYKLLATNDNVKDMLDPSDIKQFDRVDCADISGKDDKIICHYAKSLVNHGKYLSTGSDIYLRQAQASYQETLLITNSYLSESFSNYNFTAMFSGMGLMSLAVLGFLFLRFWEEGWSSEATESTKLFRYFDQSIFWTFIVLVTYTLAMFSSSLVEEEHQFWYFWHQTLWVIHTLSKPSLRQAGLAMGQMALLRMIRSWNQTGIQWAGSMDIKYHITTTYPSLSWILFVISLVTSCCFLIWIQRYFYPLQYPNITNGSDKNNNPQTNISECKSSTTNTRNSLAMSGPQALFCGIFGASMALTFIYKAEAGQGWELLGLSNDILSPYKLIVPDLLNVVARTIYCLTAINILVAGFMARRRNIPWIHKDKIVVSKEHMAISSLGLFSIDFAFSLLPIFILLAKYHNSTLFLLFSLQGILFLYSFGNFGQNFSSKNDKRGEDKSSEVFESMNNTASNLSIPAPSRWLLLISMVHSSFYAMGNSNSLASLDISNAYAGVTRYNEVLVGILLFIGNWAGPIWLTLLWIISTAFTVSPVAQIKKISDLLYSSLMWVHGFQAICTLILSIAITVHRTHLFIWTVFSPKYLYQASWIAFFYLITFSGLMLTFSIICRIFSLKA